MLFISTQRWAAKMWNKDNIVYYVTYQIVYISVTIRNLIDATLQFSFFSLSLHSLSTRVISIPTFFIVSLSRVTCCNILNTKLLSILCHIIINNVGSLKDYHCALIQKHGSLLITTTNQTPVKRHQTANTRHVFILYMFV